MASETFHESSVTFVDAAVAAVQQQEIQGTVGFARFRAKYEEEHPGTINDWWTLTVIVNDRLAELRSYDLDTHDPLFLALTTIQAILDTY